MKSADFYSEIHGCRIEIHGFKIEIYGSDLNLQISELKSAVFIESTDFNEIHSILSDLNRETSNNERPLA